MGDKNITFEQVAGLREEKEELEEIVDFLREPGKYTKSGRQDPQGRSAGGPARNG